MLPGLLPPLSPCWVCFFERVERIPSTAHGHRSALSLLKSIQTDSESIGGMVYSSTIREIKLSFDIPCGLLVLPALINIWHYNSPFETRKRTERTAWRESQFTMLFIRFSMRKQPLTPPYPHNQMWATLIKVQVLQFRPTEENKSLNTIQPENKQAAKDVTNSHVCIVSYNENAYTIQLKK